MVKRTPARSVKRSTAKRRPVRRPRTVVAAVDAELRALVRTDARLARSPLAMAARVLAGKLDDKATSPTAAASCAKELREHLAELRRRAPVASAGTTVEKIAARVAAKRKAARP